ncbi:hypothetical protein GYMLUDRAFT_52640 [Collybiopsis luxurians FD-317 M1]|nr:hypothetical protein GYMLUDRAFT_52640 [Collybiopsis luxurians FD-317 M1]
MTYFRELGVLQKIFRYLSLVDLHHAKQLNKEMHNALDYFFQEAYSPYKAVQFHLSNDEYAHLQTMQVISVQYWPYILLICVFGFFEANFGALLSGQAVDRYFERLTSGGDLIIIIGSCYAESLHLWLNETHYSLEKLDACESGFLQHDYAAGSVFTYKRKSAVIRVVVARRCPLEVILNFPNTAVMNYMSHRNAHSLFPFSTFHENSGFGIRTSRQNPALAFLKAVIDIAPETDNTFGEEDRISRNIHDYPSALSAASISSPFVAEKHNASCNFDNTTIHSWSAFYGHNLFCLEYECTTTTTLESFCLSLSEIPLGEELLNKISGCSVKDEEIYCAILNNDHRRRNYRDNKLAWEMTSKIFLSPDMELQRRFTGFAASLTKELIQQLLASYPYVNIFTRPVLVEHYYDVKWIRFTVYVKGRRGQVVTAHCDYNAIASLLMREMVVVCFDCEDDSGIY